MESAEPALRLEDLIQFLPGPGARAALYVRREFYGWSIAKKTLALRATAEKHGWKVVKVFDRSAVVGGRRLDAYEAAVAAARHRSFDLLLHFIPDLSGLGPKARQELSQTLDLFVWNVRRFRPFWERGIALVSLRSDGSILPLPATIPGGLEGFYSIRESVLNGKQQAALQAQRQPRKGRPRTAFDFSEARRRHAQGESIRKISEALGVPRQTLFRALKGENAHRKNQPANPMRKK